MKLLNLAQIYSVVQIIVMPSFAHAHNELEKTNVISGVLHIVSSTDHLLPILLIGLFGAMIMAFNYDKERRLLASLSRSGLKYLGGIFIQIKSSITSRNQ